MGQPIYTQLVEYVSGTGEAIACVGEGVFTAGEVVTWAGENVFGPCFGTQMSMLNK